MKPSRKASNVIVIWYATGRIGLKQFAKLVRNYSLQSPVHSQIYDSLRDYIMSREKA